jgi:cyclophilin family peptidyl-prolyl cis-trans isomerase
MLQSISRARDILHKRPHKSSSGFGGRQYVRPHLESLEDRVTPSATLTFATAVIDGAVLSSQGGAALPGVNVILTGDTTTGRTIDITTTTDANGNYSFNGVLPGTYSLARSADPSGFVGGSLTGPTNFTVAQGQTVSSNNLYVGGLAAGGVSLAFFVSGPSALSPVLPPAGGGSVAGYSLDQANPLTGTAVSVGSTNYVDLSSNFYDPDTTDTIVTFNTSQGSFEVELLDTSAPETVTNFLDYIDSGAYQNDLFHRIANLSTGNTGTPQILQAGGFSVESDTATPANVTGLPALTTVFQPISSEYSAAHPNAPGTIAMALSSGPDSATNEFYFNLTDNSSTLGPENSSGPFTVFGQVVNSTGTTVLQSIATNYTPTDVSSATSNSAFTSLPLVNGFTPGSTPTLGATVNDLAIINSITVTTPSKGHLSYAIVGNSNPAAVTATLGSNTLNSTFSANQLQLVANAAGSAVITLQITDASGEVVNQAFTVTAS